MIIYTLYMIDGSEIVIRAPSEAICIINARQIYDAFEPFEWACKRP